MFYLFGENLKRITKERGLNIKQTAELLFMSPSTVASYVHCETVPSITVVQFIANELGVEVAEFFKPIKRREEDKVIRVEETPWGKKKYIYACSECGAEIFRYNRSGELKKCCACQRKHKIEYEKERRASHDNRIVENTLAEVLKVFTDTDDNEFAMFSLSFIREVLTNVAKKKGLSDEVTSKFEQNNDV